MVKKHIRLPWNDICCCDDNAHSCFYMERRFVRAGVFFLIRCTLFLCSIDVILCWILRIVLLSICLPFFCCCPTDFILGCTFSLISCHSLSPPLLIRYYHLNINAVGYNSVEFIIQCSASCTRTGHNAGQFMFHSLSVSLCMYESTFVCEHFVCVQCTLTLCLNCVHIFLHIDYSMVHARAYTCIQIIFLAQKCRKHFGAQQQNEKREKNQR